MQKREGQRELLSLRHQKTSDNRQLPMLKTAAPIILRICVCCLHLRKSSPVQSRSACARGSGKEWWPHWPSTCCPCLCLAQAAALAS